MPAHDKSLASAPKNDRPGGGSGCLDLPMSRRDALKLGVAMAASCPNASPHQAIVGSDLRPASGRATKVENRGSRRELPPVLPLPQQMDLLRTPFLVDDRTTLLLPPVPSESDFSLARGLAAEMSDRFGFALKIRHVEQLPQAGRFILLGSVQNSLVRQYCAQQGLPLTPQSPGPEGYVLRIDENSAIVGGSDVRGAFYGLQSLRQLLAQQDGRIAIRGARIRDWPDKPFRGIKLFLPGPDTVPFFKRFIANFMALYKFNTLIVELNACMRFDRHPELNAGWVEFARDVNHCRRNYPRDPLHGREQNSSHQDCCDGHFLEQAEVAELVRWAAQNYIEFIPEVPSLTHAFYLLSRHPDLSEVPGDAWPDTYCPSNPRSYELLFDVMDEYIAVTKPRMMHTGHDEWFAPFGLCSCCRGAVPGELYGGDLRKIHDYLAGKNIRMAIWGDYLLESVRGAGLQPRVAPDGWSYHMPGAMTPRQVETLVPKDILVFNWFWHTAEAGRRNEKQIEDFGFEQVYGNMEPELEDYRQRSSRPAIVGGAPSLWSSPNPYNVTKDFLFSVLGCSGMLWSSQSLSHDELYQSAQSVMPQARPRLTGKVPPSGAGERVVPLNLSPFLNAPPLYPQLGVDLRAVDHGTIASGPRVFALPGSGVAAGPTCVMVGTCGTQPNPLPRAVRGIKIGRDVTSLIFLHACARAATNKDAYRVIWDEQDSADLLGWYEVVYEDGLPEIIPIRYGVNILEWNWIKDQPARAYCAAADAVVCGQTHDGPITFFAFEWTSPRLGKVVEEVRLHGSTRFRGAVSGFENAFGAVIPSNAIILKALSMVPRRV